MSEHEVVRDPTFNGRDRYACRPCVATCVRQDWMSDLKWEAVLDSFWWAHGGMENYCLDNCGQGWVDGYHCHPWPDVWQAKQTEKMEVG